MTVIWGFDLSKMSWNALSSKHMLDRQWYLRRERLIIYQLAMLICLTAECTATYSLAKYEAQQDNIESLNGSTASLHNDDLIAAECLTIVFCVFVATLFGADFFFLLFWPSRRYPRWYDVARVGLAVGITLGILTAALMSTIVVARHSAFLTGVSLEKAIEYKQYFYRPPMKYSAWPTNIAFVILLWMGLLCTAASTTVMFMAIKHDSQYGAEPRDNSLDDKING